MSIQELIGILNSGGVVGALVVFVVGTYTGRLAWRWQIDEMAKLYERVIVLKDERILDLEKRLEASDADKDKWTSLAFEQTRAVEKSIDVVGAKEKPA